MRMSLGVVGAVLGFGVAAWGQSGTTVSVGQGSVTSGVQAPAAAAPVVTPEAEMARMKKTLADWPNLGRYAEANKALPPAPAGRVVFFGDSITDAWATPKNAEVFFPGQPYVGRGISGQTTPQMVLRFQADVVALKPDAVLILAGTNDVAGNTGPETLEQIEDNLRTMAELGKEHGIKVLFCSILPVDDYPWRRGLEPSPKIQKLNAWMKEYSAKNGMTYVDYYSALVNEKGGMKEGTSSDGVHPTTAGYKIMEPIALAAVGK